MPQALPLTNRLRPSSRTVQQRIKEIQYGSGYREVVTEGINPTYETWENFGWDALNSSEYTTAINFLNAVGQWDYVTWTPFNSASQKRYRIIGGWKEEWITGQLVNISFTLRQE